MKLLQVAKNPLLSRWIYVSQVKKVQDRLQVLYDTSSTSLQKQEHYTPHHLLSQVYMAKNEHQLALSEIEKAYKLEPTNKVLQSYVFSRLHQISFHPMDSLSFSLA